jgi:hypothetical protein
MVVSSMAAGPHLKGLGKLWGEHIHFDVGELGQEQH